jgi:hypothetical protein
MKKLFAAYRWYDLVPDQRHTTVVDGFGEFSPRGSISTDTFVTAARTADGSLVMAYMPSARAITVDMTKLAGAAIARWYDPTNGTYQDASVSPFVNSGSQQFTPPGENSAGDSDWVLVLDGSQSRGN